MTRQGFAVLRFIEGYVLEHGFSPTVREVAAGCGAGASIGGVHSNIQRLVKAGKLVKTWGNRGLAVPQKDSAIAVDFPPDMRRQLAALAHNAGTTEQAVIIECVRDRLQRAERAA